MAFCVLLGNFGQLLKKKLGNLKYKIGPLKKNLNKNMKYFYNTLQELKYYQQLELRTQKDIQLSQTDLLR